MSTVLRGGLGTGNSWNGSLALTFKHHSTMETLNESEEMGCIICKALVKELKELREQRGLDPTAGNEDIGIQAGLSRLEDRDNLALRRDSADLAEIPYMYQLDFELQETQTLLRTFALKPTSMYFQASPKGWPQLGLSPQVQISIQAWSYYCHQSLCSVFLCF